FILNEELTVLKIIAGALIIAGVWINSIEQRKKAIQ
ncbi:MAG: hypothetical protein RI965_1229, partial [Bacteroidota bacterium]